MIVREVTILVRPNIEITADEKGPSVTVRIGLQLYSVRNALADSTPGALARVSELGFRYLEAANHNAADDDGITVRRADDGTELRLGYREIERARTVFDWGGPSPKPGKTTTKTKANQT